MKYTSPDKVKSVQNINLDDKQSNNIFPSNQSASEKLVPLKMTNDSLAKGGLIFPALNVTSLDEMKNELFLTFHEKERKKILRLDSSTHQPSVNSSLGEQKTERERIEVHSPAFFENYGNLNTPNKNKTIDISFGRSVVSNSTGKVDTELDDEDDEVDNSDGDFGFSGSDNFELASKSSGCCDACHKDFYKERKVINFRFDNIDYNVCSFCIKANFKKKKKHIGRFKMF